MDTHLIMLLALQCYLVLHLVTRPVVAVTTVTASSATKYTFDCSWPVFSQNNMACPDDPVWTEQRVNMYGDFMEACRAFYSPTNNSKWCEWFERDRMETA